MDNNAESNTNSQPLDQTLGALPSDQRTEKQLLADQQATAIDNTVRELLRTPNSLGQYPDEAILTTLVCAGEGMHYSCHKEKNPQDFYRNSCFAHVVHLARTPAPAYVEKEQNSWLIPSIYDGKYARKHDYQKEKGKYPICWLDIDGFNEDGSPITLSQLQAVFADVYCVIYSTKSATADHPKWRVVFPLKRLATPEEFVGTQIALNRKLRLAAIPADKVNERCAQIMYLPVVANDGYYEHWLNTAGQVCQPVSGFTFPTKANLEDKIQDPDTVIGRFNLNVTVEDALSRCGYIHKGGTKWLDPNSTSGSAAIDVFGDRWVNNGATMIAAGVGQIAPHGASSSGDAFDLFCFHFNKNNRKLALREASKLFPLDISSVGGVDLSEFSVPVGELKVGKPALADWKMLEGRQGNPKDWDTSIPFDTMEEVNEYFNSKYVCTMLGNKHKIARWRYSAEFPLQRVYQFFDENEIRKLHSSVKFESCDDKGKVKLVSAFRAWLEGGGAVCYEDTVFDPQRKANSSHLNTYEGLAISPAAGNCKPILTHIGEVLCGGDGELYNYVIRWMALLVQHPWHVHGVALVVRGQKGCGKGIIGMLLHDICGNYASYVADPEHLVGRFNNALADCIFLFADEAFYAKDRKHDGILKYLLTNPVLRIERKGLDAQQQPNHLTVYMATNSDYAVPATSDERRYCVLDASSERIGDFEYFTELANLCNSVEGRAAFLAYLLAIDLSDYDVKKVPETRALTDQRVGNMDTAQRWLFEVLENESLGVMSQPVMNDKGGADFSTGWNNAPLNDDVVKSYVQWCNDNHIGERGRKSAQELSRYLTKVGFKAGRERKKGVAGDHSLERRRLFGTVEEAQAKFCSYEKVTF